MMRKYLIILIAGVFTMSCSKSSFEEFSSHFPKTIELPTEFSFGVDGVADPIQTDLIPGTVRPVGKVKLPKDAVMLIANNWNGEASEWGDLTGHIFQNGKLVSSVQLASDFSLNVTTSILSEDHVLTRRSSTMDPDTGDELESEETIDLKELLK